MRYHSRACYFVGTHHTPRSHGRTASDAGDGAGTASIEYA
jgi:hypothetical protein